MNKEKQINKLYNEALNLLSEHNNYDEAEKKILQVLEIYDKCSDVYNFYGRLKQFQGDFNKSIELLKKSVELDKSNYMAHYNLGLVYAIKKDLENTRTHFNKYIEFCDNDDKYYVNLYLSKLHFDMLDIKETSDYYLKTNIKLFEVLSKLLIPRIYNSVDEIESYRNQYMNTLIEIENNLENYKVKDDAEFLSIIQFIYCYSFPLSYQGLSNTTILKQQCKTYRKIFPQLNYTSKYLEEVKNQKRERIKIGFISTNFFNQSVTRDRMGVIRNISREIFDVVVFYYFKPSDDLGSFIWNGKNKNVILSDSNFFERRKQIEEEKLDMLIFCDIGMAPDTFLLAFSRLAPVQCTTWGHSDTSGIDTIDYYLSSTYYENEKSHVNYSEKLVLLDSLCTFYYKIIQSPIYVNKDNYCISNSVNTYLCSQVLFKIHPNFDVILNRILNNDKNGIIIFIKMSLGKYIEDVLINRLTKTLKENMTRVHFIDWQSCEREYYKVLSIADVIMDPHPFGGCNTSFSAFGMGIPIVTYPSNMINGRFTYGLYKKMEIMDLVVDNYDDYVKMVNKCGMDKSYRTEISEKISNNSHKIFNEIDTLKSWTKFCIFANGIVHGEEDIFEYNKSNIVDKEFEDIYVNTLEEVDNNNNLINTIPKIIHFIFFGLTEFEFIHYFAIKTAYSNNKDYKIFLYNNIQPKNNKYWDKTLKYVNLIHVDIPTHINGIKLANYAHKADILRLQKLIEHGGIYLDIDVWTFKSYDNLLKTTKTCIMGYQCKNTQFEGLCNAVILSTKNSEFLTKWFKLYDNYNPNEWDTLSVYAPLELSKTNSDLIQIMEQEYFFPISWWNFNEIMDNKETPYLKNSYCIHLWESHLLQKILKYITPSYLYISDSDLCNRLRKFVIEEDKPKIKYVCSLGNSGYAISARNYISCLVDDGYLVNVDFLRQEFNYSDIKLLNEKDILLRILNKDNKINNYDILIIHTIPTFWKYLSEKYNYIKTKYGLTVWETNELPNEIINNLQFVNEVIVPSKFNYEVFSKYKKTHIIEHNFNKIKYVNNTFNCENNSLLNELKYTKTTNSILVLKDNIYIERETTKPLNNVDNSRFVFYTIGNWEKRKNLLQLINIYNKFCDKFNITNSILYIKTFINKESIQEINDINTKHKLLFNLNNLSENDIVYIHEKCDCYISTTYSEGVGINSVNATLCNNNVIISNYGGTNEYLKNNKYFVNYSLESAYDDKNILFNSNNQLWGLIDEDDFINKMKLCYDNKDSENINKIKEHIQSNYSDNIIINKWNNLLYHKTEILVIGELELLEKRMDKNIYNFVKYLQNNSVYKLILIDHEKAKYSNFNIFEIISNYCNTINPIVYSLVFTDINSSLTLNLDKYEGIKIYDVEDCYSTDEVINVIKHFNYSHVLYKYNCVQMNYIKNECKNVEFINFEHYVDNNIFKNKHTKKDIDILLYGNISDFYPFRNRLLHIFNKCENIIFKYIEHPGFGDRTECKYEPIINDDLADIINRSYITICTCSIFNYKVKKYIEVPLCNSVLCGNYPNLEKEIFNENEMILLKEEWSDNDIKDYVLESLHKIDKMNLNTMQEKAKNYTYDKGVIKFDEIIKQIINN